MATIWRGYLKILREHPRIAHAANTATLFSAGDVVAQVVLERKRSLETYDPWRTARYLGVGFLIYGPTMFVWYTYLDKIVKGSKSIAVIKKVALDQCFFLPIYLGSFVGIMSLLRREPPKIVAAKLQRDYRPLLMTSYKVWPVVQMFNFYLVPLHHRILVMNSVSLFWNTYLGWKAEKR